MKTNSCAVCQKFKKVQAKKTREMKLINFTEILNEEDLEDVRFLYKPDKTVSPMTVLEQKFAPNTNY